MDNGGRYQGLSQEVGICASNFSALSLELRRSDDDFEAIESFKEAKNQTYFSLSRYGK